MSALRSPHAVRDAARDECGRLVPWMPGAAAGQSVSWSECALVPKASGP